MDNFGDIASILQNNTTPAAAAAVGASIIGLAAISPPPLGMFPPQGLPQPSAGGSGGGGSGGGSGGGGTLPLAALQVCFDIFMVCVENIIIHN